MRYPNLESEASTTPEAASSPASFTIPLGYALRQTLSEGYGWKRFQSDVLAGIIVGVVALPLAMALAIASGVPPQYGLYTAIVSGGLIAVFGGSKTQVSGPTAAFVVVLSPISARYGMAGLAMATVLAGVILAIMGLAKFGKFIEYIPYPVTTGFTAGIATVIAVLQIKDLFGLSIPAMPEHFPERVSAIVRALPSIRLSDSAVGLATLGVLLVWPRVTKKIPSPLVGLTLAALAVTLVAWFHPEFSVATIGNRFSHQVGGVTRAGIPSMPPVPAWPWSLPGPDGHGLSLSFDLIRQLLPAALTIAILGGIESLLSAVVADGMTESRHDPDTELLAQGIGNMVGPFFGAFAATGAIARTATNIRSGATSPVAALLHAMFVLLSMLLLSPLIGYLPMASLAALLLIVAWNMSEIGHFLHLLKTAPRNDIVVLLTCALLTVAFDMVIGVGVGLVLAAMLFMHAMAVSSKTRVLADHHFPGAEPLPTNTLVYEIEGPLFFGAAQRAMAALKAISGTTETVILFIGSVPVIDATGLVSLQSVLDTLLGQEVFVIIGGVRAQPARALHRAGILSIPGKLEVCRDWRGAIALARQKRPSSTGEVHG
jgi:sulfate permease, SulP family